LKGLPKAAVYADFNKRFPISAPGVSVKKQQFSCPSVFVFDFDFDSDPDFDFNFDYPNKADG